MNQDYKIKEVQTRKAELESSKVKKTQFDLLKWDMFRIKCDQIADDWIVFKRKQKRITDLLLLILKDIMVKKIRDRFYQYREAKTRAE